MKVMKKLHSISEVSFENDLIVFKVDGHYYRFKVSELSERLAKATDDEKRDFCISPSGYGIHWPKIDEDISIQSLVGNKIE